MSSTHPATPTSIHLQAVATSLLQSSIKPTTASMYQHHWTCLVRFMEEILHTPFEPPLSPNDLALFIAYLHTNNLKHSTVLTYISAISFYHKLHNFPDPQDTFLIDKLLQGLKHTSSSLPPLTPISRAMLHQLIDHLPIVISDSYQCAMYTAVFLLMYYACLQVGEVAVSHHHDNILRLENLQIVQANSEITACILHFHAYKHSRGNHAKLRINAGQQAKYCPVNRTMQYPKLRGLQPGPIFVTKCGQPINRSQVASTLKACSSIAHLQPDSINTHSFRAGRTSDLAQSLTPSVIQHVGRWKSDAYQRYIRPDTITLPS